MPVPGVSVHGGCARGGAVPLALSQALNWSPRGGEGHTEPCRVAEVLGTLALPEPPTSPCCELGTVQCPQCVSVQQGGSARSQVTPAAPSAADGCVLPPGQIPRAALVWCLCLGTLRPKSPHPANGVSVSRSVLSSRLWIDLCAKVMFCTSCLSHSSCTQKRLSPRYLERSWPFTYFRCLK